MISSMFMRESVWKQEIISTTIEAYSPFLRETVKQYSEVGWVTPRTCGQSRHVVQCPVGLGAPGPSLEVLGTKFRSLYIQSLCHYPCESKIIILILFYVLDFVLRFLEVLRGSQAYLWLCAQVFTDKEKALSR